MAKIFQITDFIKESTSVRGVILEGGNFRDEGGREKLLKQEGKPATEKGWKRVRTQERRGTIPSIDLFEELMKERRKMIKCKLWREA